MTFSTVLPYLFPKHILHASSKESVISESQDCTVGCIYGNIQKTQNHELYILAYCVSSVNSSNYNFRHLSFTNMFDFPLTFYLMTFLVEGVAF